MKTLIALLLVPTLSHAISSDYSCETRWGIRADLTLDGTSTHVWLHDQFRRELIFQDYTKWEEKTGDKINYHFYPGNAPHTILTFSASDINTRPATMKGWIDSRSVLGPSIWDALYCQKND